MRIQYLMNYIDVSGHLRWFSLWIMFTRDCVHSGLCSFEMEPTWDGAHLGLCPFGIVPIRDCGHSGLWPFGIVAIRDCGHSGLCPFGIVSIRDCVHSEFSLFGIILFEMVFIRAIARIVVCGCSDKKMVALTANNNIYKCKFITHQVCVH